MDERKNLDERQRLTDSERLRHSAAHILSAASAKLAEQNGQELWNG